MKLFIDFETRSELDIKRVGAWKYAMHPSTDIMCLGWVLASGHPVVLSRSQILNTKRLDWIGDGGGYEFVAHGAHFEYAIWNLILHRRYGKPALWNPARWRCTMTKALRLGLPASLDEACRSLDLPIRKDMDGHRIMLQLCKPISWNPTVWDDGPKKLDRLYQYNGVDIQAERELDKATPDLSPEEQRAWEMDLRMNRRGLAVDVPLAQTCASLTVDLGTWANTRLSDLTAGKIDKASRVQAVRAWLRTAHGVDVPSLDKNVIANLLASPTGRVPEAAKEVLRLRRGAAKSSTAKFQTIVDVANEGDGRVRGVFRYHGAHTRRWAGKLIQPQNFKHGFHTEEEQEAAIAEIQGGLFALNRGAEALDEISNLLRGCIVAPLGKRLVVADYSAIEARVLFWEADDLAALAVYNRGESPYLDMARYTFKNRDIEKKTHDFEYQIGKRLVLGGSYGMGWKRFVATCATYGVPVTEELAQRAIRAYREKYRSVVSMWYATERAAIAAVKSPGTVQPAMGGKIAYGMTKDRRFLCCRLPSKRLMFYYRPSIKTVAGPIGEKEELHYWADYDPNAAGHCVQVDDARGIAEYKTYGGSLVENVTQAVANDFMVAGMENTEAAGFLPVLTVHDEAGAEIPDGEATPETLKRYIDLLCNTEATRTWGRGCPLEASGYIARRYRKE